MLLLILLVILPPLRLAQRLAFGRCPDVQPLSDFDIYEFVGEWIEIERSFYFLESPLSCTRVNFTLDHYNNDSLTVTVSYKAPWRSRRTNVRYSGEYKQQRGIVSMRSEEVPPLLARIAPGSGKYTVIDTNYDDYALIYACTNFRLFHTDFIWVLGREKDIPVEVRTHVYTVLDKMGANRDSLVLTRHDCDRHRK